MRVLLTGASGLLGTWLRRMTPDDVTLTSMVHRTPVDEPSAVQADLRDEGAVDTAIAEVRPDVVVHAAYSKDPESIVDATRHVADAAGRLDVAVVFVSTDCVFGGDGRSRSETDAVDPVSDYGRWKADAEIAVRATSPGRGAVVRMSLITSLDPPDHIVRELVATSADDGPTWYTDELRQPATAHDLAVGLWRIVALDGDRRGGVWHLPGPERLSRFEIARRLCTQRGLDPSTLRHGPAPERSDRPRDLVLDCARARSEIGWDPRPLPG